MKKFLLLLAMFVSCAASSWADNVYRIVKINSPNIRYRGKVCHVNDTLSRLNMVLWDGPDGAMQLRDMSDGRLLIWSARKHKHAVESRKAGSVPLSARGSVSREELANELNDVILFDEWRAYTPYNTTDNLRFEITFDLGQGSVSKRLRGTADGEMIITRDLFGDPGLKRLPAKINFLMGDNEVIPISDSVMINFMDSVE